MWEEVDISERHLKNCAVGAVELYGALEYWRRVGGLEHRLSVGVLEERWSIGGGLDLYGALERWSSGALLAHWRLVFVAFLNRRGRRSNPPCFFRGNTPHLEGNRFLPCLLKGASIASESYRIIIAISGS